MKKKSTSIPIIPDKRTGIIDETKVILAGLEDLDVQVRISVINELKRELHKHSPMKGEPVDCVTWELADSVTGNDYNPNKVAPPEMKLLEISILEDGYTQPIVTYLEDKKRVVVDGFHRHRVGKECPEVRQRVLSYLPVVTINEAKTGRNDRIASTIRHNRARGKHTISGMSDIVVELKRRNWSNERIERELGMEKDEILRLCQITGLSELFSDLEFSKSWTVEGDITEEDFEELTDDIDTYGEEKEDFRTVNTSDKSRIFHTYPEWECYKAGFYATTKDGMTKQECEEAYREFLSQPDKFADSLEHIIVEWKNSCEHYLTNGAMNRIAWLGQAAACYAMGIPSQYRSGFYLLSEEEQKEANEVALKYLNKWLVQHERPTVTMEEAYSAVDNEPRQSDIY